MTKTIIFTDGSSRGNPGPGGWGSIVISGDSVEELGGSERHTTNNRMELMSAIKGLESLPKCSEITVLADSEYVVKGMSEWIDGWVRRGWRTAAKKPVLNQDLWQELLRVSEGKHITWKTVDGHAGVVGNERCDEIATQFADSVMAGEKAEKVKLYKGSLKAYPFTTILKGFVE